MALMGPFEVGRTPDVLGTVLGGGKGWGKKVKDRLVVVPDSGPG